ncbi:hypothetical protein [Candidatus Karelsulcia muelleri]|uniref:hypothetical protein n=1 Tax=Candidatus Karelsulcia muelleri TaxID=336810 RepID=UPI001865A079|nr:hypothetical protein [Candidatus Karelsulcia muelleri]
MLYVFIEGGGNSYDIYGTYFTLNTAIEVMGWENIQYLERSRYWSFLIPEKKV